jgi:hypothetical protein
MSTRFGNLMLVNRSGLLKKVELGCSFVSTCVNGASVVVDECSAGAVASKPKGRLKQEGACEA